MGDSPIDLAVPSIAELHRRRGEKWALYDDDVLCLTVAEMDFPVADPIRAALRTAIEGSDLGYSVPSPKAAIHALTGFAGRRLGWEIDPEQVTLVPDVMVGLVELCRALAQPGEIVAFAEPAYPPFFAELTALGYDVCTVGLDAGGAIDLSTLEAVLAQGAVVFVLSSPHNPTGRVYSQGELAAIADRCVAAGTWVVADEIHAPLVLPGARHVPWLEVSDAAREIGIALTSASKAFNLAALKAAFAVTATGRSRDVVRRLVRQYDHASLLGTIAAEVAFTDGDVWLDGLIAQLDHNRTQLEAELTEIPGIRWTPPLATYLAWLDCTGLGLGDEPAERFLNRGRVALARGLDYGPSGAGHVRLNFATSPEHLGEAVRRMALALER